MSRTLAYLDPGSAGAVVQMIGGGAAALVVAIKLYGRKMRRLILRKEPDEPEPEPAQGPEQDAVPQRDGP